MNRPTEIIPIETLNGLRRLTYGIILNDSIVLQQKMLHEQYYWALNAPQDDEIHQVMEADIQREQDHICKAIWEYLGHNPLIN